MTNSRYATDHPTVARIAYHSSDVVFSVQPNFTNSGCFLATLDRLYSEKTPTLLRGEIPQVCIVSTHLGLLQGDSFTIQRRPFPVAPFSRASGPNGVGYDDVRVPAAGDSSPVQIVIVSHRHSCLASSIPSAGLLCDNRIAPDWFRYPAVGISPRGSRHGDSCSQPRTFFWKRGYAFLRVVAG